MSSRTRFSLISSVGALAVACVIFFTPPAAAQTRPQPRIQPPAPSGGGDMGAAPSILVATDQDYRIGPRDVIEIKVDDAPELYVPGVSVNADGTFLMPYLKRLKAAGKTTDELAKEIADGLRGRYLKDPNVMVFVKQFNSRAFFILGAVRKPGVFQVEGKPSLIKLLTIAGGLADNHGSLAIILHEVKKTAASASPAPADAAAQTTDADAEDDTEYTVRTVNINGMFKGLGLENKDIFLEPGDIINVLPADVFFVAGEVFAPGQFPLSEGTTLRQAMALAQGTTFNAAASEGIIFRNDPATGRRDEIKVDIGAVMKNRKPDIPLVAGDIVLVPNSKSKTIGNAFLKALGMGAAQRGPFIR
ncbi:MAG TPA: polysaccharide biosynthesis/export family protein [Blastocatellia bacterium]|nr:polysaccharide biosynthesis/export family protein [Blastocatellia bacterium]